MTERGAHTQPARSGAVGEPVAGVRCAVHPGRAARDHCPCCGRPRCAADATRYDTACAACAADEPARQATAAEAALRSSLAGLPVAYIGGWIASQYVEVHVFSWLVPVIIGLAASWACTAAAARSRRGLALGLVVGVVTALLGTALGFRLYPHGPNNPLTPWDEVGVPYLCAIAGALGWPLLWGTPKRGKAAAGHTEPAR